MTTADDSMSARELQQVLGLPDSTFYKHSAAGTFDRFERLPRIGRRRFMRDLVQEYLANHLAPRARPFQRRA